MPSQAIAHRAEEIAASYQPRSAGGAELLRRYLASVHFDGAAGTQENELGFLREVCRLVEAFDFDELSVDVLDRAANSPAPSATATLRRRRVIGRVVRQLRHDGELPTAHELRASRAIEAELIDTPRAGRPTLRRWLASRKRKLGWHELRWEARRLRTLEEVIAEHPDAADDELITRWMFQIVRIVVACDCPPVTRQRNGAICSCCGSTIEKKGSRPSPNEQNQRKLRALGHRYLQFRRLPTPTRIF
jgi:hypothetical protein